MSGTTNNRTALVTDEVVRDALRKAMDLQGQIDNITDALNEEIQTRQDQVNDLDNRLSIVENKIASELLTVDVRADAYNALGVTGAGASIHLGTHGFTGGSYIVLATAYVLYGSVGGVSVNMKVGGTSVAALNGQVTGFSGTTGHLTNYRPVTIPAGSTSVDVEIGGGTSNFTLLGGAAVFLKIGE